VPDEQTIDRGRILWVGPLTILSAIGAVLVVRVAAVAVLQPPATFLPLSWFFPIFDTTVLVTGAFIVFVVVVFAAVNPIRLYRRIAFVALFVSFIPDLLLPGRWPGATWPLAGALMTMHVVAWATTVTMLTRLTHARSPSADEALWRPARG
jgi:hypothetical protein